MWVTSALLYASWLVLPVVGLQEEFHWFDNVVPAWTRHLEYPDTYSKWVTTAWPDPPWAVARGKPPEGLRLVPPKQYDHLFRGPGELIITQATSRDEVREKCVGAVWPKAGAFGCSMNKSWGCHVVLAPEADMKVVGLTTDITLRHEVAHCNGWPGDHRGALPIDEALDDADVPDNQPSVMTVASQFDKFALSAVGKTVAEVASNLAQNDWTAAAQFVVAAKGLGIGPEAKVTGAVLSNPVSAEPLGRAVGIGGNLSVDQWREAHALALQTSRARQARNDPAIAAQQAQPGLPCWLSIDKPCK